MRIIIVGAGEVGTNLARNFLEEGQDVVIIDNDATKIAAVTEVMDVQALEGYGSHPSVLEEAGAGQADMLVAVTSSDEVNMVACQIAHSIFGIQTKIARIRDEAYRRVTAERLYNQEHMPVDVTISPSLEVANMITRTLTVHGAFEVEDYLNGALQMVGVHLKTTPEENHIDTLESMYEGLKFVAIFREERVLLPRLDDHLEKDDDVFFMAPREIVPELMHRLGYEENRNRDIFIIGGGHIGYNLCRNLELMGYRPKVLENNKKRAQWLANKLNNTTVLHGDAFDTSILEQEQVHQIGAVVAVTSDDATNMLSARLVMEMGAENVMSLVNKASFVPLVSTLGLERVISPGDITASRILKYLRVGAVRSVHALKEGLVEVLEGRVGIESPLSGVCLDDFEAPSGVRLCAIISPENTLRSNDEIVHAGDTVILAAREDKVTLAEEFLC